MKWQFENDRPIYIQLVEGLKLSIITGIYKQGDKIPSVRDLAIETKVNPNTMQKALTELETSGLVISHRTTGRYVTEDASIIKEEKESLAEEKAKEYLKQMSKLNFTKSEAILYLQGKEKSE